jgi:Nitronate monooxygenase
MRSIALTTHVIRISRSTLQVPEVYSNVLRHGTTTTTTTEATNTTQSSSRIPAIPTRITKLLQCDYPIILPGMSWISTPELVAAVSNAGGIGILATGPLNSKETYQSIQTIRSLLRPHPMTGQLPNFGIGATLLMPGATENAQIALQEQVPIINVSLGKPDWIAKEVHSYGGYLISTITNVKHAEAAIHCGADALLITGHEAAAHGGDVTSTVLIPVIRHHFPNVPLIAAGGFATVRQDEFAVIGKKNPIPSICSKHMIFFFTSIMYDRTHLTFFAILLSYCFLHPFYNDRDLD